MKSPGRLTILMAIPLRRVAVRTFLALTLASSAGGQAQKAANTESVRTPTIQTQMEPRPIPPEMTQRFQTLHSSLQPSVKSWVEQQAQSMAQQSAPNMTALEAAIRTRFSNPRPSRQANSPATGGNVTVMGNLQGVDIEALEFLVLMQAAQDADKDLKNIMAEVQKHNQQKQALRQLLDATKQAKSQSANSAPSAVCATPACQSLLGQARQLSASAGQLPHPVRLPATEHLTNADVAAIQQQAQDNLDSMNKMGETDSLRLQMAMDRMSKMMTTLSNLLKKVSDTSSSVVQNLK
jgi:hypothetical protein